MKIVEPTPLDLRVAALANELYSLVAAVLNRPENDDLEYFDLSYAVATVLGMVTGQTQCPNCGTACRLCAIAVLATAAMDALAPVHKLIRDTHGLAPDVPTHEFGCTPKACRAAWDAVAAARPSSTSTVITAFAKCPEGT